MTDKRKRKIRLFLTYGACVVLCASGIVSLCNFQRAITTLAYWLGALSLLAGLFFAISYFLTNRGSGAIFYLLSGIALFALGGLLLMHRYLESYTVPLLFAATLAVLGGTIIRLSVTVKSFGMHKWWVALIAGIACEVSALTAIIAPVASFFLSAILTGIMELVAAVALCISSIIYEKKKIKRAAQKRNGVCIGESSEATVNQEPLKDSGTVKETQTTESAENSERKINS